MSNILCGVGSAHNKATHLEYNEEPQLQSRGTTLGWQFSVALARFIMFRVLVRSR